MYQDLGTKNVRSYNTRMRILNYVEKFYEYHQYWPYVSHIAKGLKQTPATIGKHVEALRVVGLVDKDYGGYTAVKIKTRSVSDE